MQAFRELIKGWLGKVLLGIVLVIFGAFGTESLLSIATRAKPSAEVNGEPITQAVLERAMEFQRQQIKQRYGEDVDPALLEADVLRPKAIQALVQKELMVQYAQNSDFGVSRGLIGKWIMSMPQFQRDGQFSEEIYQQTISRLGYNNRTLQEELSKDYIVNQVSGSIAASAFISQPELESIARLEAQKRDMAYLIIDHKKLLPAVSYTEDELQTYYHDHNELYQIPEQVKVEYLELKAEDYLEQVKADIDQSQLQQAYQDELNHLNNEEERHAAHILVEINDENDTVAAKEKIEKAADELKAGKPFAEVAQTYSDDIGSAESGGDLGFAKRGDYVGPFEEALYKLQAGELSEPVKTEFGYHIIKLIEIKKPTTPTFDAIKPELEQRIAQSLAEDRYFEVVENIRDVAFNASDLEQPAASLGKTAAVSDWITREGSSSGIFSEKVVLSALFSEEVLKKGYNSDVVEISPKHAVLLRSAEYRPEAEQPFSTVRNDVIAAVREQKASDLAREKGQLAIAKLKTGSTETELNELLVEFLKDPNSNKSAHPKGEAQETESGSETVTTKPTGINWLTEEKVGRFSAKVKREIIDALFKMERPETSAGATYSGVVVDDKDFAVVKLLAVTLPSGDELQNEIKTLSNFLTYQLSQEEHQNFVKQLQLDADIVIN